jgi:hypothetical protein
MAARFRVIVLERVEPRTFRYALWADVPLAHQPFYADPALGSAWKGAIAADLTAIRNGEVTERVDVFRAQVAEGATNAAVLAAAQTQLEALWTAFQNEITTRATWNRYGSTWNGTTWTNGGV